MLDRESTTYQSECAFYLRGDELGRSDSPDQKIRPGVKRSSGEAKLFLPSAATELDEFVNEMSISIPLSRSPRKSHLVRAAAKVSLSSSI